MNNNILFVAKDKNEIINSFKNVVVVENDIIEANGKKILYVLLDSGSGITQLNIYLYTYEHNEWKLFLIRLTNTSKVNINVKDDTLIIKSKAGKILVQQPIKDIERSYNRNEQ